MHKAPNLTYVVHYYSNDLNLSITWFKYTESIANTMMYSISSAEQNVSLEVYGKMVVLLGYATSLSIRRHSLGDYSVILRNAFGETRLYSNKYKVRAILGDISFKTSMKKNLFHIK